MSLIDEILAEERRVLDQLGYGLNEKNADKNYPDSYYMDYSNNLFLEMNDRRKKQYGGGSGGELSASLNGPAKMAGIRSSSAMTFNLLGNDSINLLSTNTLGHSAGSYRIEYEKQLKTIQGKGRRQPANLDAFLESEDGTELIFCEMKMLEWFSRNHGSLKPAYRDKGNYREGRNWNPASIHLILNSMMSRGINRITDETKRYGRTYETLCSYQDYVMDSLQEIFPSVEKDELLNAVMDAFVLKKGKVSKRSLNYIQKYVDEKREGIK